MKIVTTTLIHASPDEVLDYLLSDAFIEELLPHLDAISNIDEFEVIRHGTKIDQRMRFEAPTKLPGFLKRYEAKMPAMVYWQELGTWDTRSLEMQLEIVPEAPDSWRERYDHRGSFRLLVGEDGCDFVQTLELSIHAFGLGKLIERALGPEIEDIFETRGDVVRKHFL